MADLRQKPTERPEHQNKPRGTSGKGTHLHLCLAKIRGIYTQGSLSRLLSMHKAGIKDYHFLLKEQETKAAPKRHRWESI